MEECGAKRHIKWSMLTALHFTIIPYIYIYAVVCVCVYMYEYMSCILKLSILLSDRNVRMSVEHLVKDGMSTEL